jgi:hypothetical protein
MHSVYKESAIEALQNYIEFTKKAEQIHRPFQVYKEELAYNLIGNDNNIAKAVLKLTVSDMGHLGYPSRTGVF